VRAIVHFNSSGPDDALIPIQYNHLVQASIYSSLNRDMAEFLHDRGFPVDGRTFRLFTFSRLSGPYRRDGPNLRFLGQISLQISSPVHAVIEELASTWLRLGSVQIGEARLAVDAVELKPTPEVESSVDVRTLSPVTVYETLHAADGRAKTYYYAPTEREFGLLCGVNAQRKLRALTGRADDVAPLTVAPAGWRPHRQVILDYKGTVIKAWHGAFRLTGPSELIQLVLDAGLGSKNAQGFGMVEIWEGRR
jgi:CRISPR-associated endoribonuclease Cas6